MLALTVTPGLPASARLEEVPPPDPAEGEILIEADSLGICGTDREILRGAYGVAPPGQTRLILGHESLGRVLEAPPSTGLSSGDWVCSIVRHPDPVPCPSCARAAWDMCQNGRYTEHGIKGLPGFGAERYRMAPRFVVSVPPALAPWGVLIEPASVVAKAWDQLDRIGSRTHWEPRSVLVLGAGPIGLLAAMFAAQRGFEVHVFDRVSSGPKPKLVANLGATWHSGSLEDAGAADIVLECTGAAPMVIAAMRAATPNGIVCLTGLSSGARTIPVDAGALGRELVLENNVVFGTVSANRLHYDQAAAALARAEPAWLDRLITRRVPLAAWSSALEQQPDDIKTIISFPGGAHGHRTQAVGDR